MPQPPEPRAPGLLWLFGEPGQSHVTLQFSSELGYFPSGLTNDEEIALARAKGLFPEATVSWTNAHKNRTVMTRLPKTASPNRYSTGSAKGKLLRDMALRDPIAAYTAQSNLDAHLACGALNDAGIDAAVVEDVSRAGVWMLGTVPAMHRPQVFIDRADIERARPVLEAWLNAAATRRAAADAAPAAAATPIDVHCDECGKLALFPAAQFGTVQVCPHCGGYVDVGDDLDAAGEWGTEDD